MGLRVIPADLLVATKHRIAVMPNPVNLEIQGFDDAYGQANAQVDSALDNRGQGAGAVESQGGVRYLGMLIRQTVDEPFAFGP